MDFFYKLFPYNSFFHNDENTLTIWWVFGTLVIFFSALTYLIITSRKLKKSISKTLENLSEQAILRNKFLRTLWQEYSDTFIKFNGSKKTDELAYDYFNEKNLLSHSANLKLLTSVPSILVGLGILGTFVGLTYGISNFKTSSTELIKNSIETLLSGMGTAFVSSIYGMALSIIFTIAEKIQMNSVHNLIFRLCFKLDKTYKITKEDERKLELSRQEKILSDYFIYVDEDNNRVKPANVFRDLYEESKKQSGALQAFSTDLAIKIDAGFDRLLGQQQELNNLPILQSTQEDIKALEKTFRDEMKLLGDKLHDAPKGMTEEVVKNLNTSITQMVADFKETVTGSTKDDLESLAGLIADAGSSLKQLPSRLEQTSNTMADLINKVSINLNDKVGELQVNQEVLVEKQSENLKSSASLLLSFDKNIEQLNMFTQNAKETANMISGIQKELCTAAESIRVISINARHSTENLKAGELQFGEYINKFLDSNTRTITEFQQALNKAKEVSTDYATKFSIIENELKSIFDQIQSGLLDYRESIGGSLESFLGKYTEALTKTAESLAGALGKQEDILEDLTDQLSRFNGKRN